MSETIITSRQNQVIIKICKLSDKKNRDAEKLFRFNGVKLFCEAALAGADMRYVLLRESSVKSVNAALCRLGAPTPYDTGAQVMILSDRLFDVVSEEKSPEGIITAAKYIDKSHKIIKIDNERDILPDMLPAASERIIMLEDVRDPGNLGTILRSAAALGVGCVILAGECADIYNPKTIRASMGAVFRIKTIACRDGAALVRALVDQGRRVLASAVREGAERLGEFSLRRTDCVVIGNEGHGLSHEVVEACGASIMIPMSEGSESLNAAAAAVIFMWETARRD